MKRYNINFKGYRRDCNKATLPRYSGIYKVYRCNYDSTTNKVTLLEHMTSRFQDEKVVKDALIEEFSNYDKDLRLLTFKVLLEKFNNKYADLLPEQKNVLKQFITLGPSKKLKEFINEEFSKLSKELKECINKFPQGIEKIKLQEAVKIVNTPITAAEKVSDDHLVKILQFYELLNECKKVLV